jgi:putative tryptophan/tyrosine transport system substrate-binding protein
MLHKKVFFILLLAVLIGLGVTGCLKPKVPVVGILGGTPYLTELSESLKKTMTERGYTEGENIIYDEQIVEVDFDIYKSTIRKFVEDKVDVIVAFPTDASLEAKQITQGTGIPVVFSFALVEGMGLVDSLQKPGNNITGVRYPGTDIARKNFEIMMELVPGAKKIYLPYLKGYPIVEPQLQVVRPMAKTAGVTLVEAPCANADDIRASLAGLEEAGNADIDAILNIAGPLVINPENFIALAEYAYANTIPIGGVMMRIGEYNSVFGNTANIAEAGVLAAPLLDKILKGTDAGTIPVVSSELFMEIDQNAAKALGVTIPDGLRMMADQVY